MLIVNKISAMWDLFQGSVGRYSAVFLLLVHVQSAQRIHSIYGLPRQEMNGECAEISGLRTASTSSLRTVPIAKMREMVFVQLRFAPLTERSNNSAGCKDSRWNVIVTGDQA